MTINEPTRRAIADAIERLEAAEGSIVADIAGSEARLSRQRRDLAHVQAELSALRSPEVEAPEVPDAP
ncbi:MAG: hypothetical protein IJO71_12630 [Microbacterium sp.]|uniref:hypothetical protein n=1 Tax=Microbacterium sp. TaxID=51671 RepID=UPI0026009CAB|nr:hypothetical protein [Microbacterium sp.]MBQ9918029.1 hypothetical protein [Microbacterium sp.]